MIRLHKKISILCFVWLSVALLTGCMTSHTLERAELHRITEHVAKTDSLATYTAVSDSTFRSVSHIDSIIIMQTVETIITNTVDTAGNIIATSRETTRTVSRDRNRTAIDQTSNTHTDTYQGDRYRSVVEYADSLAVTDTVSQGKSISIKWQQHILNALLNVFYLFLAVGAVYFVSRQIFNKQ